MTLSYENPDMAKSIFALVQAVNNLSEIGRRALPAHVLAHENPSFFLIPDKEIRESQHTDGGWTNVLETLFLASLCRARGGLEHSYHRAISWLKKVRLSNGGWGISERDIARLPVTGLLMRLLPELSDSDSVAWMKDEWSKDFQSHTRLTYKGGFFLMGLSAAGVSMQDCPLIKDTYSFLADEQNDDGGFGPWKDHPIGSDPWSTGIVLLGLLSYPELVKREVIEKAVNWLAEKQLPNGLWPYHYIEEGSAYAFWGLVEALKCLARRES
ncbi:MAG: prenyltransferase/squalene oxidase repeat-containing protein [Pseudomonadota bacterium]